MRNSVYKSPKSTLFTRLYTYDISEPYLRSFFVSESKNLCFVAKLFSVRCKRRRCKW